MEDDKRLKIEAPMEFKTGIAGMRAWDFFSLSLRVYSELVWTLYELWIP